MKASFNVVVETDTFVQRRLVSGPIWIQVDTESFPGEGWQDFPVVILGFWLTNLQEIIYGGSLRCQCPFMDGPFRFDIEVALNGWTLKLVERGPYSEAVLFTARVDPGEVLAEIANAANVVANLCRDKKWVDNDLDNLENLLLQMKKYLPN